MNWVDAMLNKSIFNLKRALCQIATNRGRSWHKEPNSVGDQPNGPEPERRSSLTRLAIGALAAILLLSSPSGPSTAAENTDGESAIGLAGWQVANITLGGNSSLNDVVWSGERFVAVGNGASDPATMVITGNAPILTSQDGRHWTQRSSEIIGSLESVIWNGEIFLAKGKTATGSPVILTSPDGSKWTKQSTETIGEKSRIIKIIWADSKFAAITAGSFRHPAGIFTSPDGSEWTKRWQATGSEELNNLIWTESQFLAVGDDHGFDKQNKPSPILSSPDGITWTLQSSGTEVPLKHIVWNGSQFLAVGFEWDYYTRNITAATALTSPDGVNWKRQPVSGIVTSLSVVTWNGKRYVAVGKNGTVMSSNDGAAWEHHTLDRTEDIHSIIATESQSIAVGSGSYNPNTLGIVGNAPILTSPDGVHWTHRDSGFVGSLRKIARNDTLYVAVGGEILFADAVAPSVSPPAPLRLIASGNKAVPASEASIAAFLTGAKARDNLDGEITQISNDAPNSFPVGKTVVTFSAMDSSGNVGMAKATVTVADTVPPRIKPPKPITVAAASPSGTTNTDAAIAEFLAASAAEDEVDGKIELIVNDAPEIFPVGTTKVTFSASDAAGNTGTASATVTVSGYVDTVAPEITVPADITLAATDEPEVPATNTVIASFLAVAAAEDDVDGKIASISNDAPKSFPVGATTVTFSASDRAGNKATATATITVEDTTAPQLNAPADLSVPALEPSGTPASTEAIANFLAAATARDNVDGEIKAIEHDAPEIFPIGSTTVTFNATDQAGNATTATATLTVTPYTDTSPPTVTAPENITVEARESSGTPATEEAIADFLAAATAEDDIDGSISTITSDAPAILPIGETTITFSANDAAGNVGTATATITVSPYVDSAAPTISAPADIAVEASQPTGSPASDTAIAEFLAAATARDDVDGVVASISHDAPGTFPIGTTTVTFSATDSAGNTGTATATVTVSEPADAVAPVVTAPANISVEAETAKGTPNTNSVITEFLTGAAATDDVDGSIANVDNDAPVIFPVGTTTVTFSANDSAGNAGTATATVTVAPFIDTTPPIVTPPADISVAAMTIKGTPATEETVAAFLAGAAAEDDNADGAIATVTHDAPRMFPIGSTMVTFKAANAAGLVGTATATITVEDYVDVTSPLLSPPARLTVAAFGPAGTPATDGAIAAFLAGASAIDNVDGEIAEISHNAPETFPVGDTRVTFTASDAAGNVGTISAFVTVAPYDDVTAPLVIAPENLTIQATEPSGIPASDQAIIDFLSAAKALDDVDGDITSLTNDAPSLFPVGPTTVTFSAVDAAGNSGTATATVQVEEMKQEVTEPAAEGSAESTPAAEQSSAEPASEEQPIAAGSQAEPSTPRQQPVKEKQEVRPPAESPGTEPSPADQPPAEPVGAEQPIQTEPQAEQPTLEQPPVEETQEVQPPAEGPGTGLPSAEQPSEEPAAAEQPIAAEPQAEPSTPEQLPVEESQQEQPPAEGPGTEPSSTAQPPAEPAAAEQPIQAEPQAEQSAPEQPPVEETQQGQPPLESPEAAPPSAEQSPEKQPPTEQPRVERPPINKKITERAANKLYVINISSHHSMAEARLAQQRLNRLNLETEIKQTKVKNRIWYRLRSAKRYSRSQAKKELESIRKSTGLKGIWIEKQKANP